MIAVVMLAPSPTCTARKSATVSPTVVDRILITQKAIVTSGTLLSAARVRSFMGEDYIVKG